MSAIWNTLLAHDPLLFAVAILIGAIGAFITVRLWGAALDAGRWQRVEWTVIAAVTGGTCVWATHFIATMGDGRMADRVVPADLTLLSIVLATVGLFAGFLLASLPRLGLAVAFGGTLCALSVAGMQALGMAGYRAIAPVFWHADPKALLVFVAVPPMMVAVWSLRVLKGWWRVALSGAALLLAVMSLHVLAMTALGVLAHGVPHQGAAGSGSTLAVAVVLCTLIIFAMGFATTTLIEQTHSQSERDLLHQATHDALTGLPNRRKLFAILEGLMAGEHDGANGPVTLLSIDLDRFKTINDTLGHPFGDRLLQRVARRMVRVVGERGTCARLGGDEFVVVLMDGSDDASASRLADDLIEVLSRPYVIDATAVEIGASVGIAGTSDARREATETLIQNADIAMFEAKVAGRGCARVFQPGMMTAARRRKALEHDLRRAITRQEFTLSFQPLYDPSADGFVGAEALLRWVHPERGNVPPSDFIPLAEELGLIVPIGEWVLREACATAAGWADTMRIAVNVSAVQLEQVAFASTVKQILAATGLRAERLQIEITETALLRDSPLTVAVLRELREMGITIALDDFGTGYSSLTHLHAYPIDCIKIDRSFVMRAGTDEGARKIVRSLADLGRTLDLSVTAEGIETAEQATFVAECGCAALQGYHIGRPITADALPFLSAGRDAKRRAA